MKRHRKLSDSESVQPKPTAKPARTDRIARLLSDLAELMRQEDVGKEAIHHLRQLQMRFRFSKGLSQPKPDEPIRFEKPPARWIDRKNQSETPIDFIKREYKPWLGHGLTRAHLRIDMGLYDALKHYLRDYPLPPDVDLPTKSQMIDRKLAQGHVPPVELTREQKERFRLGVAARRRRAKNR